MVSVVNDIQGTSICFFRYNLSKKACANVLFVEICVERLCATVVLLEIGAMCKKAKSCGKTKGVTKNLPNLARNLSVRNYEFQEKSVFC